MSRQSDHLNFMKAILDKPISLLQKDLKFTENNPNTQSQFYSHIDCKIIKILHEDVKINGADVGINRVFVSTPDSGEYLGVGWVLPIDVDFCMVCSTPFGLFTYKHTCRACGNVVCQACSTHGVTVHELLAYGEQRVCHQCFWGQEEVYAIKYNVIPRSSINHSDYDIKQPQSENKLRESNIPQSKQTIGQLMSSYQIPKQMKDDDEAKQQEEFQKQISANIRRSSVINTSLDFRMASESQLASESPNEIVQVKQPFTVCPPIDNTTNAKLIPREKSVKLENPIPASNSQSAKKYAQSVVKPKPEIVVKTKLKLDNSKVFVNITSHELVPYKEGSIDRVICMVLGQKRTTVDVSGNKSSVYDVVVNPSELEIVYHDPTGAARKILVDQVFALLRDQRGEDIDMSASSLPPLKIASYYKYSTFNNDSTLINNVVQDISIPTEASAYYDKRQWATTIEEIIQPESALTTQTSDSPQFPRSDSNTSNRSASIISILDPHPASSYLATFIPVSNITPFENPTKLLTLLPSDPMSSFSISELIIYPEPAFTLVLSEPSGLPIYINVLHHPKVGKLDGDPTNAKPKVQPVPVESKSARSSSVVLQNSTSTLTKLFGALEDASVKNSLDIHKDLNETNYLSFSEDNIVDYMKRNYILGATSENARIPGGRAGTCAVYDIIIPTLIFLYVSESSLHGTQARKKITIKIVEIIKTAYNRRLNNSSTTVFKYQADYLGHPLYKKEKGANQNGIPACLNYLDRLNNKLVLAIRGNIWKLGRQNKSWKSRFFLIIGTNLRYYAGATFKGEMDLRSVSVESDSDVVIYGSSSVPKPTLRVSSSSTVNGTDAGPGAVGNRNILFAFETTSDRDLFGQLILAYSLNLATIQHYIAPQLPKREGWLYKQGHSIIIDSWKWRYVTLHQGILCYFEKDAAGQTHIASNSHESFVVDPTKQRDVTVKARKDDGKSMKGQIILKGADVTEDDSIQTRFHVISKFNGTKDFVFEAESTEDVEAWISDIRRHIGFAELYPHLLISE